MTDTTMRLILASASPRRRELLARIGVECDYTSANIDERAISARTPREYAVKTAYAKACASRNGYDQGVIISADTIVVLGDQMYPKPDSAQEACEALARLAGRKHTVITGIAVLDPNGSALLDAACTRVRMRQLSPHEIREYVRTGEPMDKAGAYAAQGLGRALIESIEGDYYNVVGMPLTLLLRMLAGYIDVSGPSRALAELPHTDPFFIPSV